MDTVCVFATTAMLVPMGIFIGIFVLVEVCLFAYQSNRDRKDMEVKLAKMEHPAGKGLHRKNAAGKENNDDENNEAGPR